MADTGPLRPYLVPLIGAANVTELVADDATRVRGRTLIALSGGSTPRSTYESLAKHSAIDWSRVHLYWGDERNVSHDSPESNYRMAKETLIDQVPIPPENVHPVPFLDPAEAARRYEDELRREFDLADGEFPRFDLIFLGMGPDGHVASLFPNTPALEETQRLVVENWVPAQNAWRVTMTLPVINRAANVVVLVKGREKAAVLKRVIEGPHTPPLLPAEMVQPSDGRLLWMVDVEAVSSLERASK